MKKEYPGFLWWAMDEEGNIIDTNCQSDLDKKQKVDKPQPIPRDAVKKAELPELACKRCGATWTPRSKLKPIQCPKCKSPYWNRERVYEKR